MRRETMLIRWEIVESTYAVMDPALIPKLRTVDPAQLLILSVGNVRMSCMQGTANVRELLPECNSKKDACNIPVFEHSVCFSM